MKILEVGNVSWKTKCQVCKSKIEYEPQDIQKSETDDIIVSFIECPVCHCHIRVQPFKGSISEEE